MNTNCTARRGFVIAMFEGGTGQDHVLFSRAPLQKQHSIAASQGARSASSARCRGLSCLVRLRMKIVGVGKSPAEILGEQTSDRGFT